MSKLTLTLSANEKRRRKIQFLSQKQVRNFCLSLQLFLSIVSGAVHIYVHRDDRLEVGETLGIYLLFVPLFIFAYNFGNRKAESRLNDYIKNAASANATELAVVYQLATEDDKRVVREALIRALTTIDPDYRRGMERYDQLKIAKLAAGEDREVSFAALRALEKIGDRSVIPMLGRIAEGSIRSADDARTQDRAAACIEAIERRLQGETPEMTLLRGADEFGSPASLLRPASETSTEPQSATLLRSKSND